MMLCIGSEMEISKGSLVMLILYKDGGIAAFLEGWRASSTSSSFIISSELQTILFNFQFNTYPSVETYLLFQSIHQVTWTIYSVQSSKMNTQIVRSAIRATSTASASRALPFRTFPRVRNYVSSYHFTGISNDHNGIIIADHFARSYHQTQASSQAAKTITLFGKEYSRKRVYTVGGLVSSPSI